jgi:hypothetical protein
LQRVADERFEFGATFYFSTVRNESAGGGWVSTPGKKDMPGPQTTWIGLQRVSDFATAWKTFGPDAKKYQKDG